MIRIDGANVITVKNSRILIGAERLPHRCCMQWKTIVYIFCGIRYRLFSLVVFVLLPAEVAYAVCVVHIESVNTSTTVANTTEAIQYHFLNFFIFSAYFFGRRSLIFSESPESFLLPLSVLSLHKYPDHEAALLSALSAW